MPDTLENDSQGIFGANSGSNYKNIVFYSNNYNANDTTIKAKLIKYFGFLRDSGNAKPDNVVFYYKDYPTTPI
jgi:hypothetical protein